MIGPVGSSTGGITTSVDLSSPAASASSEEEVFSLGIRTQVTKIVKVLGISIDQGALTLKQAFIVRLADLVKEHPHLQCNRGVKEVYSYLADERTAELNMKVVLSYFSSDRSIQMIVFRILLAYTLTLSTPDSYGQPLAIVLCGAQASPLIDRMLSTRLNEAHSALKAPLIPEAQPSPASAAHRALVVRQIAALDIPKEQAGLTLQQALILRLSQLVKQQPTLQYNMGVAELFAYLLDENKAVIYLKDLLSCFSSLKPIQTIVLNILMAYSVPVLRQETLAELWHAPESPSVNNWQLRQLRSAYLELTALSLGLQMQLSRSIKAGARVVQVYGVELGGGTETMLPQTAKKSRFVRWLNPRSIEGKIKKLQDQFALDTLNNYSPELSQVMEQIKAFEKIFDSQTTSLANRLSRQEQGAGQSRLIQQSVQLASELSIENEKLVSSLISAQRVLTKKVIGDMIQNDPLMAIDMSHQLLAKLPESVRVLYYSEMPGIQTAVDSAVKMMVERGSDFLSNLLEGKDDDLDLTDHFRIQKEVLLSLAEGGGAYERLAQVFDDLANHLPRHCQELERIAEFHDREYADGLLEDWIQLEFSSQRVMRSKSRKKKRSVEESALVAESSFSSESSSSHSSSDEEQILQEPQELPSLLGELETTLLPASRDSKRALRLLEQLVERSCKRFLNSHPHLQGCVNTKKDLMDHLLFMHNGLELFMVGHRERNHRQAAFAMMTLVLDQHSSLELWLKLRLAGEGRPWLQSHSLIQLGVNLGLTGDETIPLKEMCQGTIWERYIAQCMDSWSSPKGLKQVQQASELLRSKESPSEELWAEIHREVLANYLNTLSFILSDIERKGGVLDISVEKATQVINEIAKDLGVVHCSCSSETAQTPLPAPVLGTEELIERARHFAATAGLRLEGAQLSQWLQDTLSHALRWEAAYDVWERYPDATLAGFHYRNIVAGAQYVMETAYRSLEAISGERITEPRSHEFAPFQERFDGGMPPIFWEQTQQHNIGVAGRYSHSHPKRVSHEIVRHLIDATDNARVAATTLDGFILRNKKPRVVPMSEQCQRTLSLLQEHIKRLSEILRLRKK